MRRLALLSVLALLIAACGGDSGDDTAATQADTGSDTTTAQESDPESESPDTTAAPSGGDDDGSSSDVDGIGVGTVTIGGETFEFGDAGQPGLQCMPEAFGVAFLAALQRTDGDGGINLGIPFPGEEDTAGIMPELQVSADDAEWFANEEWAAERDIPAGSSQVDSYEIDGNTIRGTATFYNRDSQFGEPEEIETGTFEVTCAG